jgi:Mg-chelatase subunit ChlD
MTDVILSLQREGYRKKDKISLIIFRGKEAIVLQKPTVYFKTAVNKMKKIKGKSYTPMAAALIKCLKLINAEKLKNRNMIPVIFVCSDCGANISYKFPDLIAQVQTDYTLITNELKALTKINKDFIQERSTYGRFRTKEVVCNKIARCKYICRG